MNSIKITSGFLGGRKIATPGGKTHPMGERERLALFNMISEFLPGAVVLDAFAGSGALGIEAISRGAARVVFIDKSTDAVRTIEKNLEALGIQADCEVKKSSVLGATNLGLFDIILADPPYDDFKLTEIEYLVQFLDKDGILVLSHPGEAPEIRGLKLKKSRQYAGATISIFEPWGNL